MVDIEGHVDSRGSMQMISRLLFATVEGENSDSWIWSMLAFDKVKDQLAFLSYQIDIELY